MHAELTLPLDISIQGRDRGRARGRRGSRSVRRTVERGNEHDAEKANIFSAASGCGLSPTPSVRLAPSLSAAVERVNRSFIAKWILWKGHARSHSVRQWVLAHSPSQGGGEGRITIG